MNISKHIASVKIENFANHKDTFVIFEKGVNVVTGTSDSGKTSLIRAIMFVLDNTYSGSFVNNSPGVKHAKVTIEFKDGRSISRIKGDKVNRVEFKNPGEENPTVFSNFSTKYPESVKKFLGDLPVDEENKALYYAHQSKKLFLIDQNEGTIPKTLSSLLNIDDLEESSRFLGSEIRILESEFKSKSKEYENLQTEIEKKYKHLDDNLEVADLVKKLISEASDYEKDVKELNDYILKYNDLKKKNKDYKQIIEDCDKLIDSLSDSLNDLTSLGDKFVDLGEFIKSFKKNDKQSSDIKKEIKVAEKICNEDFAKQLSDIETLEDDLDNLTSYISKFKKFSNHADKIKKEIKIKDDQILSLQKEYDEIKKTLIDNDQICNSCNRFGGDEI